MTQNPEVNFPVLASSSSIYWQSILIVSPDGQITYYGEISGEKMESFKKFSAALIQGRQDQFSPSGGKGPLAASWEWASSGWVFYNGHGFC